MGRTVPKKVLKYGFWGQNGDNPTEEAGSALKEGEEYGNS